ncbi:hypothetical protein B0H14DRAFT_3706882 [Mycena olivaceomarginata]|nr:hypothetical protein B0H14DRAFT_3706882 [Mycena olivaceomarginata]
MYARGSIDSQARGDLIGRYLKSYPNLKGHVQGGKSELGRGAGPKRRWTRAAGGGAAHGRGCCCSVLVGDSPARLVFPGCVGGAVRCIEDREYPCPWLAPRVGADTAEEVDGLEEAAELDSDADDLGVEGQGKACMGRASGEGAGVGRKGFEFLWSRRINECRAEEVRRGKNRRQTRQGTYLARKRGCDRWGCPLGGQHEAQERKERAAAESRGGKEAKDLYVNQLSMPNEKKRRARVAIKEARGTNLSMRYGTQPPCSIPAPVSMGWIKGRKGEQKGARYPPLLQAFILLDARATSTSTPRSTLHAHLHPVHRAPDSVPKCVQVRISTECVQAGANLSASWTTIQRIPEALIR